ncbi:MAG: ankyrin repeat domain-containing protein [Nannocystaceae bacterium]|nr:ankyrin repeat domain-containing protein [Nannocystaceae bacterium]
MSENPNSLPARPSLEQLRKQAKELLAALRRGEATARTAFAEHHPRAGTATKASLADAQLVLARQYGLSSWLALRDEVELRALDFTARAARLVALAASDTPGPARSLAHALALLRREPALATADAFTALVMGAVDVVRTRIAAEPGWANAIGGPLPGRRPLHYVAYSRMHASDPAIARGLLASATALIDAGADVDAPFTHEAFPTPLRPLYGACGAANHPAMASLLLDRGATIDDGESLYHATEHDDCACLELLLRRRANPRGTNAVAHALDYPGTRRLLLLLAAGADPNERLPNGDTPLLHGIRHGRSADELAPLLDAGADPNARAHFHGGPGRSALALARRVGALDVAQMLIDRGARDDEPSAFADLLAACTAGDMTRARQCMPSIDTGRGSGDVAAFIEIVGRGDPRPVAALVAAGVPVAATNHLGHTALHWAAWRGHADVVRVLLAAGAPIEAREDQFRGTPLAWAAHGATMGPPGHHAEVVRLLLAAGADVDVRNVRGEPMISELDDHEAAVLLREAGAPQRES